MTFRIGGRGLFHYTRPGRV